MIKQVFGLSIIGILLAFTLFVFIGSRGVVDPEDYYSIKSYAGPVSPATPKDTFSILSYNIGYLSGMTNNLPVERQKILFDTNLKELISFFGDVDVDIIGIQEIDFNSSRSFNIHQMDQVAESLGYSYGYQSINWDKRYVPFPYWPPSAHFGEVLSGQAIISKNPIIEDTTIVLRKPKNTSFLYDAFYINRLVQVTTIQLGTHQVKVLNVHLEAFDEETRIEQAEVVKKLYEKYAAKMPVLLIGDFNSRPAFEEINNGAMKVLSESSISSAISQADYLDNPKRFYTFSSDEPYQMIDYILYNEDFIQKIEAKVLQPGGSISDHLPILMKFSFKD